MDGANKRYLNTPLGVISFACSGVAGIHYGFLTEFSQVENLEDAYIVRVSPMDFDEPVKIVARNLEDFIRILCFQSSALFLADISTSEERLNRLGQQYPGLITVQKVEYDQAVTQEIFQKEFQLEPIGNLYDYFQKVRNERVQEVILPMEDGIGVARKAPSDDTRHQTYNMVWQQVLDLEKVKHFFETASYESKLGFLRDAQSKALIFDHLQLKNYLKDHLELMGLYDEAVRISYPETMTKGTS